MSGGAGDDLQPFSRLANLLFILSVLFLQVCHCSVTILRAFACVQSLLGSFRLRRAILYWHFCRPRYAFVSCFVRHFGIHSLFCRSCIQSKSTIRRSKRRRVLGKRATTNRCHAYTDAGNRDKAPDRSLSLAFVPIQPSTLYP